MMLGAVAAETAAQTTMMAAATPAQPTAVTPTTGTGSTGAPRAKRRGTALVIGIIVLLGIAAVAGVFPVRQPRRLQQLGHHPDRHHGTVRQRRQGGTDPARVQGGYQDRHLRGRRQGQRGRYRSRGGHLAAKGSTVTLKVGGGPKTATVPNVVGLTQSAATSSLQSAGFAVIVVQSPSTWCRPARSSRRARAPRHSSPRRGP